jgi:hypothetical protein
VKELTWINAIKQVLTDSGTALNYADITERIIAAGLRKTLGATPKQTVSAHLSTHSRDNDDHFIRVGRGIYGLRKLSGQANGSPVTALDDEPLDEPETGALRAFGMFWRRDNVLWKNKKLWGRQGTNSTQIDFASQVGVYLLHDRDRVIYVGRASDTMFSRLQAHTIDRLEGRWDRFSWFGLKDVTPEGDLKDHSLPWTHKVVIETLEAALIEALEPSQNRRRGDNFSAVEYLQVRDPNLDKAAQQEVLFQMAASAGLRG